jgi:hypothetical protein
MLHPHACNGGMVVLRVGTLLYYDPKYLGDILRLLPRTQDSYYNNSTIEIHQTYAKTLCIQRPAMQITPAKTIPQNAPAPAHIASPPGPRKPTIPPIAVSVTKAPTGFRIRSHCRRWISFAVSSRAGGFHRTPEANPAGISTESRMEMSCATRSVLDCTKFSKVYTATAVCPG